MALYMGSRKIASVVTKRTTMLMDTTDATATEADVLAGKTYYAGDVRRTGTLIFPTVYVSTDEPDVSIGVDGDLYLVMEA